MNNKLLKFPCIYYGIEMMIGLVTGMREIDLVIVMSDLIIQYLFRSRGGVTLV